MTALSEKIDRITAARLPLWISGPSGSGKDFMVEYIRKSGEFSGIIKTDEILEREEYRNRFFADERRRFGPDTILYFDRLEFFGPEAQKTVTEIIEHSEISPGGSTTTVSSLLVLSTIAEPDEIQKKGLLSDTLLHHILPFHVRIKPLAERKDEIPLLLSRFLELYGTENGKTIFLGRDAAGFLHDYPFPGNVRELENLARYLAAVKQTGETVGINDIPSWMFDLMRNSGLDSLAPGLTLKEYERIIIEKTLALLGGNRLKAAEMLGISERNLYRKIKEYSLT